jgi:hypothetical protein
MGDLQSQGCMSSCATKLRSKAARQRLRMRARGRRKKGIPMKAAEDVRSAAPGLIRSTEPDCIRGRSRNACAQFIDANGDRAGSGWQSGLSENSGIGQGDTGTRHA